MILLESSTKRSSGRGRRRKNEESFREDDNVAPILNIFEILQNSEFAESVKKLLTNYELIYILKLDWRYKERVESFCKRIEEVAQPFKSLC